MCAHRSLDDFLVEDTNVVSDSKKNFVDEELDTQNKQGEKESKVNKGESLSQFKGSKTNEALYTFPDLLALVFSFLFFFLSSNYIENLNLEPLYKKNGVVFLFFLVFSINAYYLLRPFSKRCMDFLDKVSLGVISALFICAVCAIVGLVDESENFIAFEKVFFIGSIIFAFDNICFKAGLNKLKEYLSIKKEYVFSNTVNRTNTENLKSATIEKIPLKNLRRNDFVHLKVGDISCFDGEVLDGEAIVSKRVYAGKAETSIVSSKLYLFAGTKILNGEVIVRVDNLLEDTFIFDNITRCQEVIDKQDGIISKKAIVCFSFFIVGLFFIQFFVFSDKSIQGILTFLISSLIFFSLSKIFIIKNNFIGLLLKKAFAENLLVNKKNIFSEYSNIKNYVFDFVSESFSQNCVVSAFKLYDERIGREYLLEALFSIFSKSDSSILKCMGEYISKKQTIIKAYRLENYIERSDYNVVSTLLGTKFIIGEESFMVEMKVQAQESDFISEPKGQKIIYVALNDMVVGYFVLVRDFIQLMKNLVDDVKKKGATFYLMSQESESSLDEIGKSIGVDLAYINGGLSQKRYLEKLTMLGEYVFFTNLNTDKKILNSSKHNIGIFDPVLCEINNVDVVNFVNTPEGFLYFMNLLSSFKKFMIHFWGFFVASALILIAMSFNIVYLFFAVFILTNFFLVLFRYRAEKF